MVNVVEKLAGRLCLFNHQVSFPFKVCHSEKPHNLGIVTARLLSRVTIEFSEHKPRVTSGCVMKFAVSVRQQIAHLLILGKRVQNCAERHSIWV